MQHFPPVKVVRVAEETAAVGFGRKANHSEAELAHRELGLRPMASQANSTGALYRKPNTKPGEVCGQYKGSWSFKSILTARCLQKQDRLGSSQKHIPPFMKMSCSL